MKTPNMYIDYEHLNKNLISLQEQWSDPQKPFKYLVCENFLKPEKAKCILNEFPSPNDEDDSWNIKTYINQKNKFTKTSFDETSPHLLKIFAELNGGSFLKIVEKITGVSSLIGDDDLFGGGLHASSKGAFLDIHVDFNIHPKTSFHRRMNIIVYLNEDWEEAYNGHLELWDMDKKTRIEKISPIFNRCVIFETNQVSFHGHPKKLNTPHDLYRKSLALYYYTKDRPQDEIVDSHNTKYVNTQGSVGFLKNINSGVKALIERIVK